MKYYTRTSYCSLIAFAFILFAGCSTTGDKDQDVKNTKERPGSFFDQTGGKALPPGLRLKNWSGPQPEPLIFR